MAASFNTVTVTTSATEILPARNQRRGAIINNQGSAAIFLGFDNTVTTSNGLPLQASETLYLSGETDSPRTSIFGIIAADSADVRFWSWDN